MSKATFLTGFAAGYVLGARAGRGRYEQIRSMAQSFARNPTVQSTASTLGHQATDALGAAKEKAAASVGSSLHERAPGWLRGQHTERPPHATNGHQA